MANKKISELPEAALPLEGTELVPIVQDGENRKAPASAFMSTDDGGDGGDGSDGMVTGKLAYAYVLGNGTLMPGAVGIQSVNKSATGSYEIYFDNDYFSDAPICVPTIVGGEHSSLIAMLGGTPNKSVCSVITLNIGGEENDAPFHIIAVGPPGE